MKTQRSSSPLQHSGFQGTTKFGTSGMTGKLSRILRMNIYTDTVLAPIREYLCNALDIHNQIGQTKPFEVTTPNHLDPVWRVRDYGTGLDVDEIRNIYTQYGVSTKDGDDDAIGGFGLGSKSGFAYTDQFTVVSFRDGTCTTWAMFLDENDEPNAAIVDVRETDEENGIEIRLPVKLGDNARFNSTTRKILEHFPEGSFITPTLVDPINPIKYNVRNDVFGVIKPQKSTPNSYTPSKPLSVKMGPVVYAVPSSFFDNSRGEFTSYHWENVVLFLNIGDVELSPGREQITLDTRSTAALASHMRAAIKECEAAVIRGVAAAPNYFEACKVVYDYDNALCFFNVAKLRKTLTYGGVEVLNQIPVFYKGTFYSLEGRRGGPPKREDRDVYHLGTNTPVILLDVTDRLLQRLQNNKDKISENPSKSTVMILHDELWANQIGLKIDYKLSELEPPARIKTARPSGETRVYKWKGQTHCRWRASTASNIREDDFIYVPMKGSSPEISEDLIGDLFMTGFCEKALWGLPGKALKAFKDSDTPGQNLVDYVVEKAEATMARQGFDDGLTNRLVWEVLKRTQLHNSAKVDPGMDKLLASVKPQLDWPAMTTINSLQTLARHGLITFELPDVQTHPAILEYQAFEEANPLVILFFDECRSRHEESYLQLLRGIINQPKP